MRIKRIIVVLVASGVVFGGVLGFVQFRQNMIKSYFANAPKPVMTVTATPAVMQDWRGVVPAVGTLQAVNGVNISSSVSGLVRTIAFQSGQDIHRGQPLLHLDSDVELGDLRSAEAEMALARVTYDRTVSLLRSNTVSQSALDKAEAELKVKAARVAGLRATIAKKTVLAPFDGTLGVRKVDLGQYLEPGNTIVNLQDLSRMLCDFTVSQKELGTVSVGQAVRMTTDAWAGETFEGVIAAVEPQVDAKTGMIGIQASFPNAKRRLRPGMFAKIEIARAEIERTVTVPNSAVSYNLHGDAVFVVKETAGADGKTIHEVERRVVQLGDRREGVVMVRKGVDANELVVTSGQVKLENGSRVDISATDLLKPAAPANP
ncbi:efflux RND transporter periplasmic adaptor subunit [Magnetospirillum molischianum]|uniref:Putative RND efflux membrane fusion protein n=1 Tax=Magnetospirillum molischianum DSM 120 TaxID=1150626 RepID=H8FU48_MAGML|nr:efflux RND transporter periplasmic adaptor subunit [Magnetospirillum molischianum]CCG41886.1 putative RND efflux membrane fusion protein precursor [Magnetospirillum molischianum DSM 120]